MILDVNFRILKSRGFLDQPNNCQLFKEILYHGVISRVLFYVIIPIFSGETQKTHKSFSK